MLRLLDIIARFSVVYLALILAGCETTTFDQPITDDNQVIIRQAELLLSDAENKRSPERQYSKLQAAELFTQVGKLHRAATILGALNSQKLPDEDYITYVMLYLQVAKAEDDYRLVRDLTTRTRLQTLWPQLTTDQQIILLSERADVLVLLGEELQGLENYLQLARLITHDPSAVINNIWVILNQLPLQSLDVLLASETDSVRLGWYKLARDYRQSGGNIRQQMAVFKQWQRQLPEHPAAINPPLSLAVLQQGVDIPKHIALLLPLSGDLAQAGQAIQMGFTAAWFDEQAQARDVAEVKFYDTGGSEDIVALYQKALEAGAELVIGPLDKDAVTKLNTEATLEVPTIALNYLEAEDVPQPNLVQMGLSVADEARQIAQQAHREGKTYGLVIAPQTNWAQKAVQTFKETWLGLNGKLEIMPPYQDFQQNISATLESALHIDQSVQREKRLARLLGKDLAFTPQRRGDVDMIFLIAYPEQARQIKPTINFLYANDLEVFSTSHIFNGTNDSGLNKDLDGIIFSAMPWTLKGFLSKHLQPDETVPTAFRQLYALGMDTYQLHQWLPQLRSVPGAKLSGATGVIELNRLGEVTRLHPWAIFDAGKVIPRNF